MEIADALIEPFTTAVAATLHEMAGVEAVARGTLREPGEVQDGVPVALRLNADVVRWAVLSFPQQTASELTRRILAGAVSEPDAGMIQDCMAELLNVIAGRAKTLTFGTPDHFTFTTPTVLADGEVGATGWSVVCFDSDAGAFTLSLCPAIRAGGSPATQAGVSR